jgi:rhomboid protease GluP
VLESTAWGRTVAGWLGQEVAATPVLIGINVLFFAVGLALSGMSALAPGGGMFSLLGASPEVHERMGEVSLALVRYDGDYWRLVTANFLHAGILHLFFNMSFLSYLGPVVERTLGRRKFVVVYLVSGVGGLGISLFWIGPFTPTLGASAAVFGLIGSVLACAAVRRDPAAVAIRRQMVRIIIFALIFGIVVRNVNNAGHIAGGILGGVVTLIGGPRAPRRGWAEKMWDTAESILVGLSLAALAFMVFHG